MADEKKLLALAKAGKVDAIFELAGGAGEEDDEDGGDTTDADELAYRWLQVAADFGHDAAEEAADDLLESSSLRYDDGQMVQGLIHLELGVEYLAGKGPLPVSFDHAKRHLDLARQLAVHETTDVAKGFEATRRNLSAEARVVFDGVFPPSRTRAKTKPGAKAKTKPDAKTSRRG